MTASIEAEAMSFVPPARAGLPPASQDAAPTRGENEVTSGDALGDDRRLYSWVQSSALASKPPYALSSELVAAADEVLATLHNHRWLNPPHIEEPEDDVIAGDSAPDSAQAGLATSTAATSAEAGAGIGNLAAADAALQEATLAAPVVRYEFQFLRTEIAQSVVRILLGPSRSRANSTGETVAVQLGRALERFASRSYEILTSTTSDGRPLIPEDERQKLVSEAELAMHKLVSAGGLNVATDFVFCLEAFGVSRGRPRTEQSWLCDCLQHVLRAAMNVAPAADAEAWRTNVRARMSNETGELYGSVDVRAWPKILDLANADYSRIEPEAFKLQLRLQLCSGGETAKWFEGLTQAANLVADLRQAPSFGPDELREIFNDKSHFERLQRQRLLSAALLNAPRQLVQQVLRQIDGNDVDISERDDEEIVLVRELIKSLGEDIRCCPHAFFKMQSDWLVTRWSGVVHNEELSPEQVCDHIEHEDNHEELLKLAVNRCLRSNRKFEAARMLARPASPGTRVYETNRNDKQLAYLVSLYQELEQPIDQFGPVDEACLVLPRTGGDVLFIKDAGESLQRLEQETMNGRPLTMGLWWVWRCLDPKLDFWPRASFVALAYDNTIALVDLLTLEGGKDTVERRCKDVLRKILEAPHILKVVHNLDRNALSVLQHAVVPHEDLVSDELPPMPAVTPMVDIGVVVAFTRKTRPSADAASKMSSITFDYLRLELCLAEALSNFERRPLRLTQIHYALTLAWAPLMVLRTLCANAVVTMQDIAAMSMRIGLPGAPTKWDDTIKNLVLSSEGDSDTRDARMGDVGPGLPGAYAQNLWDAEEHPEWRESVPMPDTNFDLATCIRQHLAPVVLTPELAGVIGPAITSLFDPAAVQRDLEVMFEAFHTHQRPQAGAQGGG